MMPLEKERHELRTTPDPTGILNQQQSLRGSHHCRPQWRSTQWHCGV